MFERNRIAETLRAAREKRELSLEQAAAAAGIPLQYVRLLEGEANVRVGISDELYLIPFFRKYAQFVGLNAEELLPEFLNVVQQIAGEGSPPIGLSYRPRWAFLWKPAAVLATIVVAVLLLVRQQTEPTTLEEHTADDTTRDEEIAAASAPTVVASEPVASPTEIVATPVANLVAASPVESAPTALATVASARPTTTPPPATPPTPPPPTAALPSSSPDATPAVQPTGVHELRIAATEETWLALAIDDQTRKQYLLSAGETRTWTAVSHFTLTVGNAGGITLALDGRELPAIGPTGKVVKNLRLPAAADGTP